MNLLRNEKGIALVTVLVLSLIALAIVSTLVYLVIHGTRFSGFFKRYESVREAAYGGAEITAALISNRGNLIIGTLDNADCDPISFTSTCNCGDPDIIGGNSPDTCLCRKLCDPPYTGGTYNWGAVGSGACPVDSVSLDSTSSPDMQFCLASDPLDLMKPIYQVSAKIVDTTKGCTDLSGEDLGGTCVACSDSIFKGPPAPYLYRVEIDSQDSARPDLERARLSVLYAY
jgi:hypothetical protein